LPPVKEKPFLIGGILSLIRIGGELQGLKLVYLIDDQKLTAIC